MINIEFLTVILILEMSNLKMPIMQSLFNLFFIELFFLDFDLTD